MRRRNEDVALLRAVPDGLVAVIADGMGGHADGDVAARLAAGAAAEALTADAAEPGDPVAAAVVAVAAHRAATGVVCGTTLIATRIRADGESSLAHVGDSRAYRIRDGRVERITEDHSWVAEQVRAGRMSAADAEHDMRRNWVTRAVTGEAVEPDRHRLRLGVGETLLLLTDGGWEPLGDEGIARAAGAAGAAAVAEAVCDAAIQAGTTDNVTVLVVHRTS